VENADLRAEVTRCNRAIAELVVMLKGHWTPPGNSAVAQITREQRALDQHEQERKVA
jgi:hypothetical protein